MKTYFLHFGDGNLDANYFVKDSTLATVDNPNPVVQWNRHPFWGALIDHPECGWILYDTGPTRKVEAEMTKGMVTLCKFELPEETSMENQLQLLGLTPKDIKHVVISHMHMDHLGQAKLFADTADFYVAKDEIAFAAQKILENPDPEWAGKFCYLRNEVFHPVKSWTYIDHDYELFPGIDVITLPGHTPCVLGLLIHSENQPLLLVSDAINQSINYKGNPPGAIYDSVNWHRSVQKVRELERKYKAKVIFGHDENQFYNELMLAPKFYD